MPAILSEPRQSISRNGKDYILEPTIVGDVAIIKAWKGDSQGNLIYRKSARNFNQDMARAAKYVIAEVEELVEDGSLESENIHTQSIFVGNYNFRCYCGVWWNIQANWDSREYPK